MKLRTVFLVAFVAAGIAILMTSSGTPAEGQTPKPRIISGPTIISEPSVDSDGDGRGDTYSLTEEIRIEVMYDEQVCGVGWIALTFQTGNGPPEVKNADYDSCGLDGVFFAYLVTESDVDSDGLSIAANSIHLQSYDGVVPDSTHQSVPSDRNHRVDGRLPDITSPYLDSAPGIRSAPVSGDTYVRGETITLSAKFQEDVVVNTGGGLPTLGLEIGHDIVRAEYVASESSSRSLVFKYEVQQGDRDDDGELWVRAATEGGGAGFAVPSGSSITDLAGNHAVLIWSVSSGRQSKVDGSITRPTPTHTFTPTPTATFTPTPTATFTPTPTATFTPTPTATFTPTPTDTPTPTPEPPTPTPTDTPTPTPTETPTPESVTAVPPTPTDTPTPEPVPVTPETLTQVPTPDPATVVPPTPTPTPVPPPPPPPPSECGEGGILSINRDHMCIFGTYIPYDHPLVVVVTILGAVLPIVGFLARPFRRRG